MTRIIKAFQCGVVPYQRSLKLQEHFISKCKQNGENSLLLLQHPPTYTIGIRQKDATNDLTPFAIQTLQNLGAEFVRTNRGGLITFHGPGQLVVYPIFHLRSTPEFQNSIRWYVCQLEGCILETCSRLGIETAQRTNDVGIWIGNNKIAALGIHCSNGITSHGIAINCDVDLNWFRHIVPCGLKGKGVTSFSHELKRPTSVEEVQSVILQSFQNVFKLPIQQEILDVSFMN